VTRVVDFDAIRAEIKPGEPVEVRTGRHVFHVHPEMPWDFAVAWAAGRVQDALALLVPAKELDQFRAAVFADNASRETALARIQAIYDVGESKASSRSSTNGGTRSRPTSKRTTGSTSAGSSGATSE
jgi:hypothetical protein